MRVATSQQFLEAIIQVLSQFFDYLGLASRLESQTARRFLIIDFHSSTFGSRNPIDGSHEFFPAAALRRQHLSAFTRQAVVTPPPLAGLFHPATQNPAAFFQPVQKRIQRSDVELKHTVGTSFN